MRGGACLCDGAYAAVEEFKGGAFGNEFISPLPPPLSPRLVTTPKKRVRFAGTVQVSVLLLLDLGLFGSAINGFLSLELFFLFRCNFSVRHNHAAASPSTSPSRESTPVTPGDYRGGLGPGGPYAYLPPGCGIPAVSASACAHFAQTAPEFAAAQSAGNVPKAHGARTVSAAATPHHLGPHQRALRRSTARPHGFSSCS